MSDQYSLETRGLAVSLSLKTCVLKTCVLTLVVLFARAAAGQEAEFRPWEPFGPAPVDQAGAGRRGYVLPAESADVLRHREASVRFHRRASA